MKEGIGGEDGRGGQVQHRGIICVLQIQFSSFFFNFCLHADLIVSHCIQKMKYERVMTFKLGHQGDTSAKIYEFLYL